MKKYHICDLLTFSRWIIAVWMLWYAMVVGKSLYLALVMLGVGELTDAWDGHFHEKYPYPDDGLYRFWRVAPFPKVFDTGSDLLLIVAFVLYLFRVLTDFWLMVALYTVLAMSVAVALFVIFIVYFTPVKDNESAVIWIVGTRRFLYVVAVFVVLAIAILALNLNAYLKCLLLAVLATNGYIVYHTKKSRLTER